MTNIWSTARRVRHTHARLRGVVPSVVHDAVRNAFTQVPWPLTQLPWAFTQVPTAASLYASTELSSMAVPWA